MNKNNYQDSDKDGPCHNGQRRTLSIAIATWIILAISAAYASNVDIKAQTTTPANQDVTVSTTIKVPSVETPTPSPTVGPTSTPAPAAGPTITPSPAPAISSPPVIPTITKVRLIIFGYGPADTPVSLTGKNVLEITTSDRNGYFEFVNVPLPDMTNSLIFYPELCLQAYYKEASTQPVCLPKIPTGQDEYKIGPVLISPILFVEKQDIFVNSQVRAIGKAIPHSPVSIYLAKEKLKSIIDIIKKIKIVQKVSAYYLPKYELVSDENGNFEFNLPAESQAKWRIFASYSFENQNSPKSNTLLYEVMHPTNKIIKRFLTSFLNFILDRPINAFIILQILLVITLSYLILKKQKKAKKADAKRKKIRKQATQR